MTQVAAYQVMVPVLEAFRTDHQRARIRLSEGTTASLERDLEQDAIDVAFVHPPLHAPGLAEAEMTRVRLAEFDGMPDQPFRRPLIRFPRVEAPVLMGALLQREEDGDDFAEVEADTMLGAIVLSRAGFGPFVAPEDYPSPFPKTAACLASQPTELEFITSVAWRRLDRRPLVEALVAAARTCADSV